MTVAGMDTASRRLACVWPETTTTFVFQLPALKKAEEPDWGSDLALMRDHLQGVLAPVDSVWIERPIAGQSGNVSTALRMALTVGMVAGVHAGDVHLVHPSTWKAAVVGNGRAKKQEVAEWLERWHPALAAACAGDQDLRDAACVGLYGLLHAGQLVEGASSLPRQRLHRVPRPQRRRPHAGGGDTGLTPDLP